MVGGGVGGGEKQTFKSKEREYRKNEVVGSEYEMEDSVMVFE